MADREPMVGAEVEVTVRGRVRDLSDSHLLVQTNHGAAKVSRLDASVELLEPADDPSKDLVGTVRKHPMAKRPSAVIKTAASPNPWRAVDVLASDDNSQLGQWSDEHVKGWDITGLVPGTPAAERAVTAEQVEQWETDDLELGDDGSETYARAMADAQRDLVKARSRIACPQCREIVTSAPPVDPHKPVVLKRAETAPRKEVQP